MHLTDLCDDLIKIPAHAGTIAVTGLPSTQRALKLAIFFLPIAGINTMDVILSKAQLKPALWRL